LAILVPASDRSIAFQVRVRMTKRRPTDVEGVRANFLVGTSGSDDAPVPFGDRRRNCYAASIGNDVNGGDPSLRSVRAGSVVRVAIRVTGQPGIVRRVRVTQRFSAIKSLGCGKQP
jgi:hypothetical protein